MEIKITWNPCFTWRIVHYRFELDLVSYLGGLMRLFDFFNRRSKGVPLTEAPDRLVVSVAMVKELIEIYRSRGFVRDPRAEMIGNL